MGRTTCRLLVVLLLAVVVTPLLAASQVRTVEKVNAQLQRFSIQQLPLQQRTALLNKKISLEGFYYDGSVPMVIEDVDLARMDKIMPTDSYVVLEAALGNAKSGDRVLLQGQMRKIGAQSIKFRVEGPTQVLEPSVAVLQVSKTVSLGSKLKAVAASSAVRPAEKYAVLIFGGANPDNNHIRYWNDLKTMYAILRANGYAANHIFTLYAYGGARDSSTPVTYSATRVNVNRTFRDLGEIMKGNDTLYLMTNDHGGQTGDDNGDEADGIDETLCLWGESMRDDEFAASLNQITHYGKMIIQMKQCFCGGFIKELMDPKRVVMASARESEVSWGSADGQYGEFTYHYFGALTGVKPDAGNLIVSSEMVHADTSGDGKVSFVEAYNYARANDAASEHPKYDDNGAAPAPEGAMPSGSDGAIGASLHLDD
jgi:hypothetical protein